MFLGNPHKMALLAKQNVLRVLTAAGCAGHDGKTGRHRCLLPVIFEDKWCRLHLGTGYSPSALGNANTAMCQSTKCHLKRFGLQWHGAAHLTENIVESYEHFPQKGRLLGSVLDFRSIRPLTLPGFRMHSSPNLCMIQILKP